MMNSVGVNVNDNNQLAFRARKINDIKIAYRTIDKINDAAVDFINKDRPLAEKRETLIRKSLSYLKDLKIKDLSVGKKVKPEEAAIEHMTRGEAMLDYLDYKYYIDKAVADGMMDPEKAKILLFNKGIELSTRVESGMSTWEMIKEIAKNMLKKS